LGGWFFFIRARCWGGARAPPTSLNLREAVLQAKRPTELLALPAPLLNTIVPL
jgi:hypothetical protein